MPDARAPEVCCNAQDPRWTQRIIQTNLADIQYCGACGKVLATELYVVPLRLFPLAQRCVNCGGQQDHDVCPHCGKSEDESVSMHEDYATNAQNRDLLGAALDVSQQGRHALGLKLASAAAKWGEDTVTARVLRLEELQALGERTRALNEAVDWAETDAPGVVWGVIAQMEIQRSNNEGAIHALERGLHQEPENTSLATDYAELMSFTDNRPTALHYATKCLADPEMQPRCIAVIADVGERFFAEERYDSALKACARAGSLQERYVDLAWLRARIFAVKDDKPGLKNALEAVLALDPQHPEALPLMNSLKALPP